MKKIKLNFLEITGLLVIILISLSFAKPQQPLQFLSERKNIVARQGFPDNHFDTLTETTIRRLSSLNFKKTNFDVGKLGATPNHSIALFDNQENFCSIYIWSKNDKEFVMNINHKSKQMFLCGYQISKDSFNSILPIVTYN